MPHRDQDNCIFSYSYSGPGVKISWQVELAGEEARAARVNPLAALPGYVPSVPADNNLNRKELFRCLKRFWGLIVSSPIFDFFASILSILSSLTGS
jgi:hypothetical protein